MARVNINFNLFILDIKIMMSTSNDEYKMRVFSFQANEIEMAYKISKKN